MDPAEAVDVANEIFGVHPGSRALHAKGQFYSGTFTPSPEAAGLSRAAHLQAPVPVRVRWSNGSGNPRSSDKGPDVRGMAVSFQLPDGAATDIVAQTAPRFPVKTPEAFAELMKASEKQWKLPLFMARHPNSVVPLLENVRAGSLKPPRSYATAKFFAIHAYKWVDATGGSRWVRYTLVPLADGSAGPSVERDRNYLATEMAARLEEGPVRFSLRLQIAQDGDDPHNPMSNWSSKQVVGAGVIEVTAPSSDPEAGGGLVVFDPVRITDGIELSDDPILRFRPLAYSVSASRRAGGSG